MEDQESNFLITLLDQNNDHDIYFVVGDPSKGPVERIGITCTMLMAHSLVCRRALSEDESELEHRGDIALTDITKETFYRMIKYCYGYTSFTRYTLPELVDLVKVADRLWMSSLKEDLDKAIRNVLTVNNITTALSDPVCLRVQPFQDLFEQIIKTDTAKIVNCPGEHLLKICPNVMRCIIKMNDLEVGKGEIWRFIVKWARAKVLDEYDQLPGNANQLETLNALRLIQCSWKFSIICSLNLIQLVEEACSKKSSGQDISTDVKIISNFHFVPNSGPKRTLVCTRSFIHHLTHEEFDVKIITDCSAWTSVIFRKGTELFIYTKETSVELHSVVCSGCKKHIGELNFIRSNVMEAEVAGEFPHDYDCLCTVKTTLISPEGDKEKFISVTNFRERLELDKEFEITLHKKGEQLILKPESKYRVEIVFSAPHPLWFANDVEYFPLPETSENEAIDVRCGQISKLHSWYGSHAKYILFREI